VNTGKDKEANKEKVSPARKSRLDPQKSTGGSNPEAMTPGRRDVELVLPHVVANVVEGMEHLCNE